MSKIIFRDKRTAKTREVDAAKWEALPQKTKDEILAVADMFPVPEPAMREAEVIAGLGDEGPSTLESLGRGLGRGVMLGRGFDAPTTIGGAVAEAAGSGLRDAALAGLAAKRGMPALAKAVPTLTGAAEGALDPNLPVPGIAERATGAVVGGLLANIPTPKILERATAKLGTAVGEAIGRRQVKAAEKGEKVAAAAMKSADEAMKTADEAMKTAQKAAKEASEEASFYLEKEAKNPGEIDRLKETLEKEMTPEELAIDADYAFILEAKKQLDATKKAEDILKKSREAFEESEKTLKTSKKTLETSKKTLKKTQKGVEPMTTAGSIAAGAGTQSAMADLIRQAPQQAVAAVAADPRLQGRELSSITPAEMYEALKRAIKLAMDPQERARNIAITDAQLKAAKKE